MTATAGRTSLKIPDFAKYPELRFINKHDWIGPWLARHRLLPDRRRGAGSSSASSCSTVLLWHSTFLINSVGPRRRSSALRHRRHQPELRAPRGAHAGGGVAQQPPSPPGVGPAGIPLVAMGSDLLRHHWSVVARSRSRCPGRATTRRPRREDGGPRVACPSPLSRSGRPVRSGPARLRPPAARCRDRDVAGGVRRPWHRRSRRREPDRPMTAPRSAWARAEIPRSTTSAGSFTIATIASSRASCIVGRDEPPRGPIADRRSRSRSAPRCGTRARADRPPWPPAAPAGTDRRPTARPARRTPASPNGRSSCPRQPAK